MVCVPTQAAGHLQRVDDDRHGLPDVLAAKQGQVGRVHAIALHGVQDVLVAPGRWLTQELKSSTP